MQLEQRYLDILEETGWDASACEDGKAIKLRYDLLGDDNFHFVVPIEDFTREVYDYYQSFDVDKYIYARIEARKGKWLPRVRTIVNNAEEIESKLELLFYACLDSDDKEHKKIQKSQREKGEER